MLRLDRLSSDKLYEKEHKSAAVHSGYRQEIYYAYVYCNQRRQRHKRAPAERSNGAYTLHNTDRTRHFVKTVCTVEQIAERDPYQPAVWNKVCTRRLYNVHKIMPLAVNDKVEIQVVFLRRISAFIFICNCRKRLCKFCIVLFKFLESLRIAVSIYIEIFGGKCRIALFFTHQLFIFRNHFCVGTWRKFNIVQFNRLTVSLNYKVIAVILRAYTPRLWIWKLERNIHRCIDIHTVDFQYLIVCLKRRRAYRTLLKSRNDIGRNAVWT